MGSRQMGSITVFPLNPGNHEFPTNPSREVAREKIDTTMMRNLLQEYTTDPSFPARRDPLGRCLHGAMLEWSDHHGVLIGRCCLHCGLPG